MRSKALVLGRHNCSAAELWNSLQKNTKDKNDFHQFKRRLDKYLEGNPLQVT